MPVRWSSTYVMLEQAEKLKDVCFDQYGQCFTVVNTLGIKQDVDTFVHEISGAEKDRDTQQKLSDLQLSPDEWEKIGEYYEHSAESDAYIVAMCEQISFSHLASLPYTKSGILIST